MLRSSTKVGLLFITSALSVMGFDAYRDYRSPNSDYSYDDADYGDFSSGTTRPSGGYSHGAHYYHSSGFWGFFGDDYHHSSSGYHSSSMSHTSRGGFGGSGHGHGGS